jgi:hypothetical protein
MRATLDLHRKSEEMTVTERQQVNSMGRNEKGGVKAMPKMDSKGKLRRRRRRKPQREGR